MTFKLSSYRKATVLVIVVSFLQFYLPAAFAETNAVSPQATLGRLRTRSNEAILANGISVKTGATIMSGATVETGDMVSATIDLGPLGAIDLAPNSKVLVEFRAGEIKITILQGCAIVRTKAGTYGQIYTEKGLATSNDPVQRPAAVLDVCYPSGAPAPIVNQGAAANAGAGAAAETSDRIGAGWIWLGVFGGGAALVGLLASGGGGGGGGTNPSLTAP